MSFYSLFSPHASLKIKMGFLLIHLIHENNSYYCFSCSIPEDLKYRVALYSCSLWMIQSYCNANTILITFLLWHFPHLFIARHLWFIIVSSKNTLFNWLTFLVFLVITYILTSYISLITKHPDQSFKTFLSQYYILTNISHISPAIICLVTASRSFG